jgi:hypothetical protein
MIERGGSSLTYQIVSHKSMFACYTRIHATLQGARNSIDDQFRYANDTCNAIYHNREKWSEKSP